MGIRAQGNPIASFADLWSQTGTGALPAAGAPSADPSSLSPDGHEATGGVVSDWADTPGAVYRTHVFTGSGTFTVTALSSTYPADVDFLVIAGGGAGGGNIGGGGGAGGLRTSLPEGPGGGGTAESAITAIVASYPIVVGAGGAGAEASQPGDPGLGAAGVDSTITHPTGTITSTGGGRGGGGASYLSLIHI